MPGESGNLMALKIGESGMTFHLEKKADVDAYAQHLWTRLSPKTAEAREAALVGVEKPANYHYNMPLWDCSVVTSAKSTPLLRLTLGTSQRERQFVLQFGDVVEITAGEQSLVELQDVWAMLEDLDFDQSQKIPLSAETDVAAILQILAFSAVWQRWAQIEDFKKYTEREKEVLAWGLLSVLVAQIRTDVKTQLALIRAASYTGSARILQTALTLLNQRLWLPDADTKILETWQQPELTLVEKPRGLYDYQHLLVSVHPYAGRLRNLHVPAELMTRLMPYLTAQPSPLLLCTGTKYLALLRPNQPPLAQGVKIYDGEKAGPRAILAGSKHLVVVARDGIIRVSKVAPETAIYQVETVFHQNKPFTKEVLRVAVCQTGFCVRTAQQFLYAHFGGSVELTETATAEEFADVFPGSPHSDNLTFKKNDEHGGQYVFMQREKYATSKWWMDAPQPQEPVRLVVGPVIVTTARVLVYSAWDRHLRLDLPFKKDMGQPLQCLFYNGAVYKGGRTVIPDSTGLVLLYTSEGLYFAIVPYINPRDLDDDEDVDEKEARERAQRKAERDAKLQWCALYLPQASMVPLQLSFYDTDKPRGMLALCVLSAQGLFLYNMFGKWKPGALFTDATVMPKQDGLDTDAQGRLNADAGYGWLQSKKRPAEGEAERRPDKTMKERLSCAFCHGDASHVCLEKKVLLCSEECARLHGQWFSSKK
jgi:hypothetical protein